MHSFNVDHFYWFILINTLCIVINFSKFWTIEGISYNQTWHKASLVEGPIMIPDTIVQMNKCKALSNGVWFRNRENTFGTFIYLFQNHWTNFSQNWCNTSCNEWGFFKIKCYNWILLVGYFWKNILNQCAWILISMLKLVNI